VVAGPIGAAAGFAVQGLLGRGLNRAAGKRYQITGTWDKPVMAPLEVHEPAPPLLPLLNPADGVPGGNLPSAASSVLPAASRSVGH